MNAILPVLEDTRHKVTVDELEALLRAGFLSHCERLELIDGVIVEMPHEGFAHVDLKAQITEWLMGRVQDPYRVVPDATLRISSTEAPAPDIRIQRRDVPMSQITGADVALIIEIADSSLATDTKAKPEKYAAFGVLEYWVIDLENWQTVRFQRNEDGMFNQSELVAADATVRPSSLPEIAFRLADFKLNV
ncbi:MAG: Uma2 family endonuclease [Pseudomonadota bacterium]